MESSAPVTNHLIEMPRMKVQDMYILYMYFYLLHVDLYVYIYIYMFYFFCIFSFFFVILDTLVWIGGQVFLLLASARPIIKQFLGSSFGPYTF